MDMIILQAFTMEFVSNDGYHYKIIVKSHIYISDA